MIVLYAFTIFVSALFLFLVQPMLAKMLLPRLGGSPSVWNTCMVFFQALLLAAYAYAHWSTTRLGARRQSLVHLGVILLACIALPIALPSGNPDPDASPIPWLLSALAISAALPFFLLSTTSPLIQRWLADTRHPLAANPYPLYAASNAGSLLGLLAYPVMVEPVMTLAEQSRFATGGLLLVAALQGWSILLLRRSARPLPASPTTHVRPLDRAAHRKAQRAATPAPTPPAPPEREVTRRDRFVWTALAFVPSSLLLGVTQHLSTDIVAMPMLWAVPLALYLITFIVAFSAKAQALSVSVARLFPIAVCALALIMILEARRPIWIIVTFHLLTFFLAALLSHATLAARRPAPARLTEFYLFISVGGVLGGVFNALLAPFLFNDVIEYPLALTLAALARPALLRRLRPFDLLAPAALAAYVVIVNAVVIDPLGTEYLVAGTLAAGLPALAAFLLSGGTVRFTLALAVILASPFVFPRSYSTLLHVERTFFGVYRVARPPDGRAITLLHGTTIHGEQPLHDGERLSIPSTYYHPFGPLGRVFTHAGEDPRFARVGLVGMGVGSLVAFARPGDLYTFHEIDPAVVRIAKDPRYFTYLRDAAGRWDVLLGDGRKTLEEVPDATYGVLVLDAFTSDAIPVHLLTLEAFDLYRRKLRHDGLLAVHVSNRYLDLRPIIAGTARQLGMACFECNHDFPSDFDRRINTLAQQASRLLAPGSPPSDEAKALRDRIDALEAERSRLLREGLQASVWFVLTHEAEFFDPPPGDPPWQRIRPFPDAPFWTDDYSNVLATFRGRGP